MRRIGLLLILNSVLLLSLISNLDAKPAIKINHVASIPCRDPETKEPFSPLGLDILPDGRLLVVDGDRPVLWVLNPFDSTFRLLFDCSVLTRECRLVDVAAVFPKILCSEDWKRGLIFLDMQGQVEARLELEKQIGGIGVSDAGDIFGCAGLDRKIVEVCQGFSLVDIHLSDPISYPVDCVVLRDGRVAITDNGSKKIRLIDPISGKQRALNGFEFESPWGVDVFEETYLVVSDAELATILVIDLDGNVVGEFKSKALTYPTFLACSSNGLIFVSDQANLSIEVLSIDGKQSSD